ncbi:MAG: L-serine ammonia-lyase, iron-sulfur-dependent, subunit alpha [Caloramator sp.]|nr:L-serine ammonia-lyase, iron-sulfur-dependent, subunit alpha [Caloramator sp.]
MNYDKIVKVLNQQVKPALGCTEPVAVGIAVARACKEVKGEPDNISVKLSPNIFKNGMRVGIPGTSHSGIPFAIALSAVCGDSDLGLEVFKNVTLEDEKNAEKLLCKGIVEIGVDDSKDNFYIRADVKTDKGYAVCIIEGFHTNITYVEANGNVIYKKDYKSCSSKEELEKIGDLTIKELIEIIENIPFEDIRFLLEGEKINMEIAAKGLEEGIGLGLGRGIKKLIDTGTIDKDMANTVRFYTAAASDARMAGVNMPVMSSAGSGNHGITAIIPASIVCRFLGYGDEKLSRALALSHLVTVYIKEYTGRLSPVCGCGIAAGVGACASVAWLIGCDDKQIEGAIKNMIGNLAGLLCDGAKGGCAFKLSTASSEAVIQAYLAKNNVIISDYDGIVSKETENTIKNLGKLCKEGLSGVDNKIIEIMLGDK